MGITEPAYLWCLDQFYRSAFIEAITGGAVGGILAGFVQLKRYAVVSPGLITIPTFISRWLWLLVTKLWFSSLLFCLRFVSHLLSLFSWKERIRK